MPKINELSKDELLCLIYNNIPDTIPVNHSCYCGSCGKGLDINNQIQKVYICDNCNKNCE